MKVAIVSAALLLGGATVPEVDAKPRTSKRSKAKAKAKSARRAKPPVAAPVAPEPAPEPEPAPVPEPTPAPEPAAAAAALPPRAPAASATPALEASVVAPTPRSSRASRLELSVDDGPMIRRLRYTDDWARDGQTVRDYDLVANAIGLRLALRPLSRIPVALYASGELITASGSRGPDDEVFATRSTELQLGVRIGATLLGVHAALELAAGQHAFAIDDEMSSRGELVPDTSYRYARAGTAAVLPLGARFAVSATAGFRLLSSSGGLAGMGWFPRSTGNGVDGSLGVSFAVTRSIDAFARAHVRHYFFAMNPEPGDALVVGGAIDQYIAGVLGLSLSVR
jgi:hypothetical protein